MLHQNMVLDSMRHSEMDEIRKSHRAGLCDGTRVTDMERLGNLHELLVMSYTKNRLLAHNANTTKTQESYSKMEGLHQASTII